MPLFDFDTRDFAIRLLDKLDELIKAFNRIAIALERQNEGRK